MKLGNKGYTLVELLAVIVVLSIVVAITAGAVITYLNKSKDESYKILIDSILTASKLYYEECLYSNTICNEKPSSTVTISLNELVQMGFLSGGSVTECTGSDCEGERMIMNPKTNEDIGSCQIRITMNESPITYDVVGITTTNSSCPIEIGSVY